MNDDLISRTKRNETMIGKRFGRLTVVGREKTYVAPCGTKRAMWKCLCDCGNEIVASTINLTSGNTKSCGCLKTERIVLFNTSHGGTHDRLYGIWKSMKHRCNNPNDSHYGTYGGKGISICDEWNDYKCFKDWAYKHGYDEDAEYGECTLDRIDNDGNYEPSNCRFVNRLIQANNTSKNHIIELNGHKMTIAEFARIMNIDKNHAWYYIDKFEREVENGQLDFKTGGD